MKNGRDIKKAPWENSEGASTNPETATMQRTNDGFGKKATVISENDGAKINKNLDIAKSVYAKRENSTKGFITDIARALGLKRHESSQYGTFITPNGKTFTLRVSNHNATVSNFDKNGEDEGISVVVSSYPDKELKNDGKAHITEFFYKRADINRSTKKPLVEILDSLQKMLQTGEYVDTTGLAHVEEVNKRITPEQSSLLRHPNYAQYPTNRGLSESKDTLLLEEKQAEWGKDDLFYTLALTLVPGLGLKRQHELLKRFKTAKAFFEKANRQQALFAGTENALTQAQRRAETELDTAVRNGWHLCPLNSPDYPPLLRDCPDAPLMLFIRSQLPPASPDHALKRPALGIVGTRNASHYGLSQTDNLVAQLQTEPISTVSGLAIGIDTQAHRSSLDYGLPTVAVVGHGLEQVYPPSNRRLAQEIIDKGGAIITEMPSGTPMLPSLFPRRNRIIAGLSQAVVVAEASIKGGALITARIAHSYNRSLYAFPGRNDMEFSQGCNFLIKTQMAQLLESADDLRAETVWTWGEPAKPKTAAGSPTAALPNKRAATANLNDAQRALLQIIQRENPADIELLTYETNRPLPELLNDLLALELAGCIRTVPGNRYEPA